MQSIDFLDFGADKGSVCTGTEKYPSYCMVAKNGIRVAFFATLTQFLRAFGVGSAAESTLF
jgi:hypothetical protein